MTTMAPASPTLSSATGWRSPAAGWTTSTPSCSTRMRGSSTTCWTSWPATARPRRSTARAREAGELPDLLDRVRATRPDYLADLEWLAEQRDRGAFVSVADYRRGVLGDRADTMAFRDDLAVTLEVSALQYFPWLDRGGPAGDRRTRSLMPGRWIRVRKMKEQEADGDLPALAAAMQIIGASFVETLDTKGTDGSNIHLGGPATITGYFGGVGQPNDHPAAVGRRVPPLLHDLRRPPGPQHQPGHRPGRLPAPPARHRHRVQDLRLHGQRQPVRRAVDAARAPSSSPATTAPRRWSASTGATRSTTRPSRSPPRSAGRSGSRTSSASSTTSPRPGRASSSSRTTGATS